MGPGLWTDPEPAVLSALSSELLWQQGAAPLGAGPPAQQDFTAGTPGSQRNLKIYWTNLERSRNKRAVLIGNAAHGGGFRAPAIE